ncbi:hypothetical protein [Polaribacter marinivivus]|uniref:Lipoprotein n=1 Tax=Polaribacter marinivivus TaxID=1524260 RepID=A0ABV8R635_9FLAO
MKTAKYILFLFLILSCSVNKLTKKQFYILNENLYGNLKNGFPEKDTLIEIKKGKTLSIGKVAVGKGEVSNLKFGNWKKFNEKGILLTEGQYKIGKYEDCGMGGLEQVFYYYKTGIWKFFNESGELEFELEFIPKNHNIETRCEGGEKMLFGIVEDIPLKYKGRVNAKLIFELQKIEYEDPYVNTITTPLNGKVFVKTKIKQSG